MLFNSVDYIAIFLPIVLFGFFLLPKKENSSLHLLWLAITSLFFYGYWKFEYLYIITASIAVNFGFIRLLDKIEDKKKGKLVLLAGIVFNLSLLGFYKYFNFFLDTSNYFVGTEFSLLKLALPLGISFFTFQQITLLVDIYKGQKIEVKFLPYAVFVTWFPQLIAGPIVHHSEVMPQLMQDETRRLNYNNISAGVWLFCIGLFKKIFIADTLAQWASPGFDAGPELSLIDAWVVSLSFTFQLYYDFSAYSDMARGAARMFNVDLPLNFDSPYRSLNVQEFWRRWHMTLSRFLRDYIYIPLGGNRVGSLLVDFNLFITFVLGGIWHGAGWNFLFWGGLHGGALVLYRHSKPWYDRLPKFVQWAITLNFANVAWIFFRAKTWEDALRVLRGLVGMNGLVLPHTLQGFLPVSPFYTFGNWFVTPYGFKSYMLIYFAILAALAFAMNSNEMEKKFKPTLFNLVALIIVAGVCITNLNKVTEFLYFNF